ncbi:MAG: baseplate J/gp47 family protein [Steroidobacteraceae bacterium]
MSAVPQIQWTPTGLVVPTAAAVLAGCQADINAAFGGNLNFTNPQTPQSQLATSWAANINAANAALAYFVNNIDPDVASGFMQDAVGRIYFLNRNPGLPTVVQCVCTGAQGTVIPLGAQAQDTSGNLYVTTAAGTIGSSGNITLPFQNVVLGPIACPANTLTNIYQQIPGWDTINNPTAGVVGANVESQAAFALRRAASVASNSQGALQSVYGAVFNVPDVIDVYCYENPTNVAITVGQTNYSMVANSIYVGVAGGSSADIAQAIYTKKSPGCNMNGNTTVVVPDTSGYQSPVPTYNITFNDLTDVPIYFAVQIQNSASVPSNIVALVQAAIIAQFTGANGAPRARAGAYVLASQYYAPIIAISPGSLSLISVLVGLSSPGTVASVLMGIDQEPTISAGNISVVLI